MNRTLLAMLASLLIAAQCDIKPTPAPVGPDPIPTPADGGTTPPDPAPSCSTACRNLEQLGCDEAKPTPAGATCVEVCENVVGSGTVRYPIACVTSARSCAGAEDCFR